MLIRTIAILFTLCVATAAHAHVYIYYDPSDGNLTVTSTERRIVAFEMVATHEQLRFDIDGINTGVLVPPFDEITPDRLFKLAAGPSSFATSTLVTCCRWE